MDYLRYHKFSIGFCMEISTIEAGKGQQQGTVFTGGRDCHWRNIINSHSQQLQHNNIIMEIILGKNKLRNEKERTIVQ